MDTHPQNAPLCYVKPTADMSINVSMFVDHNGKIYLPYLHDWQPVSEWCRLQLLSRLTPPASVTEHLRRAEPNPSDDHNIRR